MAKYLKFYQCSCGETWQDEWDCLCDDRCPRCNTSCEVAEYEEIGDD